MMKLRNNTYLIGICVTIGTLLGSCIKNDIPYPTVYGNFTKFEVSGQLSAPEINTNSRTIAIKLADTVELSHVKVVDYEVTSDTKINPGIGDYIDLSATQTYTLTTYQQYKWTISATQTIERYISIAQQQIGQADINDRDRTVTIYVPTTVSVDSINLTDLKLGPSGSTVTPAKETVTDFTYPQKFTVSFRNKSEEWTLFVIQTQQLVSTLSADAWVQIAWLKGSGGIGLENGFEMKKATETTWTKVSDQLITHNGGEFTGRINGLTPETEYIFRAYSGTNTGEEISFTTEAATPLPNSSFEQWSTGNKDVINPWEAGGASFWDTGNGGAITLNKNVTISTTDKHTGNLAALLQSQFVGIGTVGKFAAGNIFTGTFLKVDGFDGVLEFGRPYTSRPTKLKFYYKYIPQPINYASSSNPDLTYLKGKSDTCNIYIALCDWDSPLTIKTKPSDRQLFSPSDPGVIAYAEFRSGESTADYKEITLELKYKATNRKAKYIVIVGTASKYGDFFTGGSGSTLTLDDFELLFD